MRTIDFHGIAVVIEVDRGQYRGENLALNEYGYYQYGDYGYIENTSTSDGEDLDVYLGTSPASEKVFLLPLLKQEEPGVLDEFKVLLGFQSYREAQGFAWLQYPRAMQMDLQVTSMDDLKQWVNIQKPLALKMPATVPSEDNESDEEGIYIDEPDSDDQGGAILPGIQGPKSANNIASSDSNLPGLTITSEGMESQIVVDPNTQADSLIIEL